MHLVNGSRLALAPGQEPLAVLLPVVGHHREVLDRDAVAEEEALGRPDADRQVAAWPGSWRAGFGYIQSGTALSRD